MPTSHQETAPPWRRSAPSAFSFSKPGSAIRFLILFALLALPSFVLADSTETRGERKVDPNAFDIAVIIDNRTAAASPAARQAAKDDVKAIADILDRHMFADHIVRLERPSFAVICDIFGGCPNEARHVWPSLLAQITERGQSRLYVYYLGPGRIQGLERQLLFRDGAYTLGWLHKQLQKAKPKSGLVIAETSFAPRPLPCASESPTLIDASMKTVQRNYTRLLQGRSLPDGLAEITAAMPAQAPHCDRYAMIEEEVERPLFTKFLLKGIVEGQADKDPFGNEDGDVELGELARYTSEEIRRAVRFQWGRRQSVWLAGPDSRVIAKVEPRPGTIKEKEEQTPTDPKETEKDKEQQQSDQKDERTEQRHVCDLDTRSEACLLYCARNPGDFRYCTGVCAGAPISDGCPCTAEDPREGCARQGSWCSWSGTQLGGAADTLINVTGAESGRVCHWATNREPDPILSFLDAVIEAFTPIGWRLARPLIRRTTACALNCQGRASPITASLGLSAAIPASVPGGAGFSAGLTRTASANTASSTEADERPRPKPSFEQQICDDQLPPYISLPRWMPGTLAMSEALRLYAGCEPEEVIEPMAPGDRFAHGLPPPVPLVDAPAVPKPRYRPPPRYAMPPPVTLPPIQPPGFEPSISEIRWLQSALLLDSHNPGPIDGDIGPSTEAAIMSWREDNGITPLEGALTEAEFLAIIRDYGEKFDQLMPAAPLY